MEDETQIQINDTTYSLMKLPPSDTPLVRAERTKLLRKMNLNMLVEDLGNASMCIRIAKRSVMAEGSKFLDLQLEIQRLGLDVIELCNKSAGTMLTFEQGCTIILSNLKVTYEYLLSSREDLALETFMKVSEIARQRFALAEELHKDFKEEATKVLAIATKVMSSQEEQTSFAQDLTWEQEELRINHKHQQKDVEDARNAEEEAERRYRKYEMKEDEAIQNLGDDGNLCMKVLKGLASILVGTQLFFEDVKSKEQMLEHWKVKKEEAVKKCSELESKRKEAYQHLVDSAVSIRRCKDEQKMVEAAVKALHIATNGLDMLAVLMMQAALFWKRMDEHCKALEENNMKETVKKAMRTDDDAERRKLWTSKDFKRDAVTFYASWVAFDSVCVECEDAIREIWGDLRVYIQENPSYEDAKSSVEQLAIELQKALGEARKEITERDSETEEEI